MPVRFFILNVCVIFFCAISLFSFSQNKKVDSLKHLLTKLKEDTNRVIALNRLGGIYRDAYDSINAFVFLKEAQVLSRKLKYNSGLALSYFHRAYVYHNFGFCKRSLNIVDTSLQIPDIPPKLFLGIKNLEANNYILLGKYQKAIVIYLETLPIAERLEDYKYVIRILCNMSIAFKETEKYDEALNYALKALSYEKKISDEFILADLYSCVGSAYYVNYIDDSVLIYHKKAHEIWLKLGNEYSIALSYNVLGVDYLETGHPDKALPYFKKGLELRTKLNDKLGIANSCLPLAILYTDKKDYKKALEFLEKGLPYAMESGSLFKIQDYYDRFASLYQKSGQFKKAYDAQVLYTKYRDSILNEENSKLIAEAKARYETEKKEKENAELKRRSEVQELVIKNENEKRKTQLAVSFTIFGLIAGSGFFVYNRRKLKQKALHAAELADLEKNRFKDVMEAEEKERGRIAQELHDGLGQLLSTARLNVAGLEDSVLEEDKSYLNKSLKIIDEACVEVRNISHNMMPSALIRLGLIPAIKELTDNINASRKLRIDLNSNVADSLGKSLDITIYRIVQEVLNNMIRHAKADQISIDVHQNGKELLIQIKDNGIGFDTGKIKNSPGIGWKNIFSRVSMLDGTIELDSKPQQGTIVFIKLFLKND